MDWLEIHTCNTVTLVLPRIILKMALSMPSSRMNQYRTAKTNLNKLLTSRYPHPFQIFVPKAWRTLFTYLRGRRGKSARIAEDTSYRREQEETVSEAVAAAVTEDVDQNIETADQAPEPEKLDEEKVEKE